jgi:5-methylcytosine-specific restriction endonuclease McrA
MSIKTCVSCKVAKDIGEFTTSSSICKECKKKYDQERHARLRNKRLQQMKDWYANNTITKRTQQKAWSSNNPGKTNAISAKRRARKRKLTPAEIDSQKISKFYEEAQLLSRAIGIPFQVDHVVPLDKGGLHSEYNLRVISRSENCSKLTKDPTEDELLLAGKLRFPEFFES